MKSIPLTQGHSAIVDDSDFEKANQFNWHVQRRSSGFFAVRRVKKAGVGRRFYLHECLFPGVRYVEHLDGNGLNYQRENLRPLSSQSKSPWTKDLVGNKYGRWTVLRHKGVHPHHKGALWLCRCDCGAEKIIYGNTLITGGSSSCGCFQKEFLAARKGDKHPSWKGGRRIDRNGYVLVNNAKYPGCEAKKNTTAEHIAVMAQYLGRSLLAGETVHHRNGIKHDNRIENLELWKSSHPSGQRVEDLVGWAKQILREYSPESLSDQSQEKQSKTKTTNQR